MVDGLEVGISIDKSFETFQLIVFAQPGFGSIAVAQDFELRCLSGGFSGFRSCFPWVCPPILGGKVGMSRHSLNDEFICINTLNKSIVWPVIWPGFGS